jgi:DNA-binding NarL/FixJ family response regulator
MRDEEGLRRLGSQGALFLEVLQLLVEGKTDRETAEALFISPRTAMSHVANIRNKLGVDSRTAATAIAIRESLV